MLSFPTQNDKKKFPNGRVHAKKQTWLTTNQQIFKSGPRYYITFFVLKLEIYKNLLRDLSTFFVFKIHCHLIKTF